MFRSLGIDNVFLYLRLPLDEIERLIDLCSWYRDEQGSEVYRLLGTKNSPTITLQRDKWGVIVNLNIPKLAWDHNIKLAGPKEIREAFARFERLTGKSLKKAQVLRVDVCLCEETNESLSESLALLKCPRGFTLNPRENGCYVNGKHGRVTLLAYCKSAQFEKRGEPIPRKVLDECDSFIPTLLRYELRIGNEKTKRLTCTELRRLKLWTSPYFLGSDLHSANGFNALVHHYQNFMLTKVVPPPGGPQRKQSPPRTLNALKARTAIGSVDHREPGDYLQEAMTLQERGEITDKLFAEVRAHVQALQYRNRVLRLHITINELCSEVFAAYPVTITAKRAPILGRIPATELHRQRKDVTRES